MDFGAGFCLETLGLGHYTSLHQCGGNDNTSALDEEGDREGSATLGVEQTSVGEEEAAAEEEDDREEGLEPAVGM